MAAVVAVSVLLAMTLTSRDGDTAQPSLACDPVARGLPQDAPHELVAFFDDTCAKALVAEDPSSAPFRAISLGQPQLLIAYGKPSEVMDLLSQLVLQGDRGFFRGHPGVLAALPNGGQPQEKDRVATYLSALFAPQDGPPPGQDAAFWARSLPVYEAPAGAEALRAYCSTGACEQAPTVCPGEVGLGDKLRLVTGQMELSDLAALCPPSPEWVLSLRRAGVIDTSCTASFQVNRALQRPDTVLESCAVSQETFDEYVMFGYGAEEVIMLLRQIGLQQGLAILPDTAFDLLADHFPSASSYLKQRARGAQ